MKKLWCVLLFPLMAFSFAKADGESLLVDQNGDGAISIVAFGDSITYGIGDSADLENSEPDFGGYPARLASLVGVSVANFGDPGEEFTDGGSRRFSSVIQGSTADIAVILEGSNDAFQQVDSGTYRRALQRSVNIAKAAGKKVLLVTLLTPCCEHGQLVPFVTSYSGIVEDVAGINEVPYADARLAWKTTCTSGACELYRLPEGLHPNPTGYDVLAQTIAAALVGVNVFEEGGAQNLESALGLAEGTVLVKPFVVAEEE